MTDTDNHDDKWLSRVQAARERRDQYAALWAFYARKGI